MLLIQVSSSAVASEIIYSEESEQHQNKRQASSPVNVTSKQYNIKYSHSDAW